MIRIIVLLAAFLANPCLAKIASLDIVEIYKNYSLVKEANQEVDQAEASFKRILETAQKEILELEGQAGKEKELANKKAEIQEIIDEQVNGLQDSKDLYNTQINRHIAETLQEIATEKKLELIVEKGYVMTPIEDITDEFVAKLEKRRKKK